MKDIEQLKGEVQNSLEWRVGYAVNDVHTFMRAKSNRELRDISNDFEGLGGGNFLSAMAGLVLLEAMAVTFACIRDKARVIASSDVEDWKSRRDELCKTKEISKTALSSLNMMAPRLGSPKNTEDCVALLADCLLNEAKIDLGYSEAKKHKANLWTLLRNGLAHRLAPGFETAAAGINPGWLEKCKTQTLEEDHQVFRKFNDPVFRFHKGPEIHPNGSVYVMGEWLVLAHLPRIREWLAEEITKCSDLEALQLAALNNLVSIE